MKKKFITALLAGAMVMVTLAGCSLGETGASDSVEDDKDDDKQDDNGDEQESEDVAAADTEESGEKSQAVVLHDTKKFLLLHC